MTQHPADPLAYDGAPFHGAKLALFIGDQLVCIRRDDLPDIPFPDHWDFPGGGREGDETPWQTAVRETREELSLDLSGHRPVWSLSTPAPRLGNARVWMFAAHLAAEAVGRIQLGDEGQEWRLFPPDQYFRTPRIIPSQADRLRLYLSRAGG